MWLSLFFNTSVIRIRHHKIPTFLQTQFLPRLKVTKSEAIH